MKIKKVVSQLENSKFNVLPFQHMAKVKGGGNERPPQGSPVRPDEVRD